MQGIVQKLSKHRHNIKLQLNITTTGGHVHITGGHVHINAIDNTYVYDYKRKVKKTFGHICIAIILKGGGTFPYTRPKPHIIMHTIF